MQDIIGKFFMIVLGTILLFFVPVTIIALKQDNTAQVYIDNAVSEFVDNARATARITPESYEKLVQKVDAAQPGCNIQIIHSSAYVMPDIGNDELSLDDLHNKYEYTTHKEDYYTQEILNTMFYDKDGHDIRKDYLLKSGDFLKVIVDNNDNPTLGAKLIGIVSTKYNQQTLYTSYGGYIGNYAQ